MRLAIKTKLLGDGKTWFAEVDKDIHDGGQKDSPSIIAYGSTEDEAHERLKEKLTMKGHVVKK